MRRNILFILVLLLSGSFSWAQQQPFGNEWIRYEQTYFKIPVAQTSLYRITATDLLKAGIPIHTLNPVTLQLFHRGIEQAIYVAGETDNRFDTDDFLEFYGRANDGAQDSLLYKPARAQPHAYYSLFSDTTAYFLTWRLDGQAGKRMEAYTDTVFTNLTPEAYYWVEALTVYTQTYSAGTIYPLGADYTNGVILTEYDVGEGWTGSVLTTSDAFEQTFTLTNYASASHVKPRISCLVVGRNPQHHRVNFQVGASPASLRLLGTSQFQDYHTALFDADLTESDLSQNGTVLLTVQPQHTGETVSVSYLKIQYPQRPDLNGTTQKTLCLNVSSSGRSWLDLANATSSCRLLDISDPANVIRINGRISAGHWQGVVHQTQQPRTLLAISQPVSVIAIKPVSFRKIDPAKPNYLIVTHPVMQQPATNEPDPVRAYAAYRASDAGGHYDTLTVTVDQLFDQFSYGERHPLSIRRFADYMLQGRGAVPVFMFLIGQSRDPQGIRKAPNGALLDLVPNAGWPGSDLGLVEGLHGEPANVPALLIGRLNASRSQSVLDYLNKVKEHENTTEPALWRKEVLHLSGGNTPYELQSFRSVVDDFKTVIQQQYVGANVTTLSKQTDNSVETIAIADLVNRGFGMISMFGHSSLDVADIDIGFVSNDRLGYRNQGRYPFLLVNGCAAGNFYFGRPTFGTDWMLTPNRGAVLFMAHTYNGFAFALKNLSDQLYRLLADSTFMSRPLAFIQREAIRRHLAINTSVYDITTAQQVTLQGDPALSVFPFARPDVAVAPGSLRLRDTHGDSLTANADSVVISGVLLNYGRVTNRVLSLRIRRYGATGALIREQRFTRPAPFYADTLRWTMPNDPTATGINYIELRLDPDNDIDESNETNNKAEVSTAGPVNELPFRQDLTPPLLEVAFDRQRIQDGDFVSAQPVIDVLVQDENPTLLRTDTTGLELYLQRPCGSGLCPYERLSLHGVHVRWVAAGADNAFRLSYQPPQPLADGLYAFDAIGRDLSGNQAAPYRIHFRVKNVAEVTAAGVYPNPFSRQTRMYVTLTGLMPPADLVAQISDLTGRVVRTLRQTPRVGRNEWVWDGTSDAGSLLPNGLYLYTINGVDSPATANVRLTGRLILNR